MKMQIIIPMSGFGERFRRAGYKLPKPLIEIEGKPIIGHVIDMFPNESDFFFICNQEHLDDPSYQMESTLKKLCPTGSIIAIAPHKLGPIHAVIQIESMLDMSRPAIVNYCDFTCYWDWAHFKNFVQETGVAGAIPAYKGFHPHCLGSTNYAYLREENGWVYDIQEKMPYTSNRMQEYASSGTYYFSSARLMMDAFCAAKDNGWQVGGEYYASLAYKDLFAKKMPVAVYELQHFMQWGTPEDVNEYCYWSDAFKQLIADADNNSRQQGSMVIPMAGLGQRFANEGYSQTKPLIPVSGLPMVMQAAHDLPQAQQQSFVLRSDMPEYNKICEELKHAYPNAVIASVEKVTEGQACTALIGLDALGDNCSKPVTFGACDNGALYNLGEYQRLADDPDIDIIVWAIRGYPNALRHPHMFGWIKAEGNSILSISVKKPLGDPASDPIVLGTFTFRRDGDFRRAFEHMLARNGRINGEFYIDELINDAIALGLRCKLFEVDSYLCWGTPNDLRTFEYWQSCFHKWQGHPYRLELDGRIPKDQVKILGERYRPAIPKMPKPYL